MNIDSGGALGENSWQEADQLQWIDQKRLRCENDDDYNGLTLTEWSKWDE